MVELNKYASVHLPAGAERWEDAVKVQPPDARLCPVCLGMRFVQKDVPAGDPDFSKVYACPTCRAGAA